MKDSNNVAKVLIYKDGKYLVFTRADNKKNDLPGGHVHVNEEFMMGAIREVYEESKNNSSTMRRDCILWKERFSF